MLGIVDVGGGTRGIFGAGVFDYCLKEGINFDVLIGVSAGSANVSSFLAGQKGRNYVFYNEYSKRKEYMSLHNFIRSGSFINFNYIYGDLSNEGGEYPLDYDALMKNPSKCLIVATDVESGFPVYFDKENVQKNHYDYMSASCCIPVVNKPCEVEGKLYFDGGLANPIPYLKAFESGCDKVVVILTRPKDFFRDEKKDEKRAIMIKYQYPKVAEVWAKRGTLYNEQLREILKLEEEGKICIVAPDSIGELKTLSSDHEALEGMYKKGLKEAERIKVFIQGGQ